MKASFKRAIKKNNNKKKDNNEENNPNYNFLKLPISNRQ